MPTDHETADEQTDPSVTGAEDDGLRAELLARWDDALPHQRELGESLLKRYAEPHRRYHTATHLRHVLRMVDQLAGDQDLFLVRLAAWFHDAIYDIPARELINEEASARLALRELSRAGLEQEDLTQVARLVRMTETHVPGARDPEGELLSDADLAILAADPQEYKAYVAAVRAEYAELDDQTFMGGRLAVLTELAGRDIFRTQKGRKLAAAARANLEEEMRDLTTELGEAVEGSRT